MGMAYQQAPAQSAQAQKKAAKPGRKPGLKEKLHALPRAAGIALLIAMLALSLPAGNYRALQNAEPKAFARQGEVASILEDRADAAANVLTVARRAGLPEEAYAQAEQLARELEKAKTARDISRADQNLTAAVSVLIDDASAKLGAEDQKSLTRAADDFAEQGSFLRQEARAFNEKALKADALYEKLPMKFMLPRPDVYEGI